MEALGFSLYLMHKGLVLCNVDTGFSPFYNSPLNFMLPQQQIQIFHLLSHYLIACSDYSRTRQ